MNYIEYGKENSDVIVLLHGGGLTNKALLQLLQGNVNGEILSRLLEHRYFLQLFDTVNSYQNISFFKEKKLKKVIAESETTKEWNQRFQNLNNAKDCFLSLKIAKSITYED